MQFSFHNLFLLLTHVSVHVHKIAHDLGYVFPYLWQASCAFLCLLGETRCIQRWSLSPLQKKTTKQRQTTTKAKRGNRSMACSSVRHKRFGCGWVCTKLITRLPSPWCSVCIHLTVTYLSAKNLMKHEIPPERGYETVEGMIHPSKAEHVWTGEFATPIISLSCKTFELNVKLLWSIHYHCWLFKPRGSTKSVHTHVLYLELLHRYCLHGGLCT